MKIIYAIAMLAFLATSCNNDQKGSEYPTSNSEITWIDMSTADKLKNSEEKMYFIDMYTDWCGWCKVMDKNTFTNKEVINYMTNKFHSVKFNAEQRESISFNGKEYSWAPSGRNGINLLAVELLKGRLSYPSYVILDSKKNILKVENGYMPPEKFLDRMQSNFQ